jgi:hypothetical protein
VGSLGYASHQVNITALPDDDRIWLSLTVDGGSAPTEVPLDLPQPSASGADGNQWWLEWTSPPLRNF